MAYRTPKKGAKVASLSVLTWFNCQDFDSNRRIKAELDNKFSLVLRHDLGADTNNPNSRKY